VKNTDGEAPIPFTHIAVYCIKLKATKDACVHPTQSYSSYCEVANLYEFVCFSLNSRLDPLVVGVGLGGGVRNVLPDDDLFFFFFFFF